MNYLSRDGPQGRGYNDRTSLIDIWLGQGEGVADQLDARLFAFGDNHFDDIEAKENIGIIEQPQPGEAAARDSFLFVPINGVEGSSEIFARPRFHFDENQSVALATDDVDFAPGAAPEITIQDLVTVAAQEPASQVLPLRSKAKMPGTRNRKAVAPPVRKIGDESDKARVHAI